MKDLLKKCLAELLGTFVLVFFACGVAAYTGGDVVPTALAFGLVIVAMAYTIGRVSGCHINPAVSLGCLIGKRITVKEFVGYIIAQVLGAVLGGILSLLVIKMAIPDLTLDMPACNSVVGGYDGGFTFGNIMSSILVELVLTTIFVFVILTVTDGHESIGKKAGLIIGLTLTLVHLVGIPLTGTSVNPARSLAPALFLGGEPLSQVWVFIVGPFIGAIIAALLYKFFAKEAIEG